VKTQSKVLNSLRRTPVFLQNSPKKRPFFLSILGQNSAVSALAVAAEELAPIFIPRVFRWKTGDLPLPAAGQSAQGRPHTRLSKRSNYNFARFLRCHGSFAFIFDSELSRHEPTLRPASQEMKRNWDKAIFDPFYMRVP
jgi:hypothetical protein